MGVVDVGGEDDLLWMLELCASDANDANIVHDGGLATVSAWRGHWIKAWLRDAS